jgi:hypothetical protein
VVRSGEYGSEHSIYLSMPLQPFVGPGPLFQFLNLYTVGQSVGPFGRGISPSQGRYLQTEQQKHNKRTHRHPCLKWDWNPRRRCSSGRRQFISYKDRAATVIRTYVLEEKKCL